MSANDGGAAFPSTFRFDGPALDPIKGRDIPAGHAEVYVNSGMSLRDYFAAQIVAGTLLVAARNDTNILSTSTEFEGDAIIASRAYKLADAMLRERTR